MSFVLDIILIAIILLCVLLSAKKGFVKVVVETVGFVAAIIIAFTASTPLADATYDNLIEPPIISAVETSVEEAIDNNLNSEVKDAFPKFLINNADRLGISLEKMESTLKSNATGSATEAVKSVSQDVLKPVTVKVLGMVYSLILVIILLVVVKFLAKIINKLFSFSVVGKLNRTLGGVVGVLKGSVIAIILCLVVSVIMTIIGDFLIFTSENVDNSILFKFIVNTFVVF